MKIYVDIDGILCNNTNGNYNKAKPIRKTIEKVNILYDKGNTIVLWTARCTASGVDWKELTKKQMKEWNVKYHELRFDKPHYDIFIDDRTINSIDKIYQENLGDKDD